MCGRYSLARKPQGCAWNGEAFHPRYNIAPTQKAVVVQRGGTAREAALYAWGFPPGWSGPGAPRLLINARSETLLKTRSFAPAFRESRCLVPADGFYEWSRETGQPVRIRCRDREVFFFAGIATLPEGGEPGRFVILTTAANELLRPVHHRMPVILPAPCEDPWLDPAAKPEQLLGLLAPYPGEAMAFHPVSDAVSQVANDGPECWEAPSPPRQGEFGF